jgi:hypothetical protein
MIPTYLRAGLEANVDAFTNKDLKFINTSTNPMILKLSIDEGRLQTEMYTSLKDVKVSVRVSRDEEVQARTITRYSAEVAIGETQQLQEGVAGLRVSIYRTVSGVEQLVSRDYYPPVNRIVLKSSHQPLTSSSTNNLNNDSRLEVDLDGDGFPDEEVVDPDEVINSSDSNDHLPPGSYYDKGGNIITPKKGGD